MASYSVVIAESAVEELRAVPFPFRRQLNQQVFKLKSDPRPDDAELLTDPNRYRMLVSGWWLLYEIDDSSGTVRIVAFVAAA